MVQGKIINKPLSRFFYGKQLELRQAILLLRVNTVASSVKLQAYTSRGMPVKKGGLRVMFGKQSLPSVLDLISEAEI